eukprot:2106124-Pyramimonas_sp.AAC.1
MERAVLLHEKVEAEKWKLYSGRARGPAYCWKLVRSTPGRAHMRKEHAQWWGLTSTRVITYASLKHTGSDLEKAAQCVVKAHKLIERAVRRSGRRDLFRQEAGPPGDLRVEGNGRQPGCCF